MNIHNPVRIPSESLADYRERRAMSKLAVQRMTLTGKFNTRKGSVSSREQLRSQQKANGTFRAGAYGKGLRNHFDSKN